MAITIGSSNISSLQAQKSLSDATSKVADAYKQLSSGLRINQASDDAAGLAIATALNSKARVYAVGVRNVNDAISASNIAEGALNALKGISERQLELTEQAATGTYSNTQRNALNTEANALVNEYNRIVSSTTFNGLGLFDPNLGSVLIQAGNSTLKEGFSDGLARAVGDGTFQTAQTFQAGGVSPRAATLADFDGDGWLDVAIIGGGSNISVLLSNHDGTFKAAKTFSDPNGAFGMTLGDVNGDGKLDLITSDDGTNDVGVFLSNGDGNFQAIRTFHTAGSGPRSVSIGDLNGDGKLDLVTGDFSSSNVSVFINNGDGSFQAATSFHVGGAIPDAVTVGDLNGDGKLDIITGELLGNLSVFLNNGNATFAAPKTFHSSGGGVSDLMIGDINGDGRIDVVSLSGSVSVFLSNGDGTLAADKTFAVGTSPQDATLGDVNGDGWLDIATADNTADAGILLNNGDGTFGTLKTYHTGSANPSSVAIGDIDRDGRPDLVTTDGNDISVFEATGAYSSTSQYLNLYTQANALDAQNTVNGNLSRIEAQLGSIGATGSKFQTALNNLQVQSQNFTEAASRIQDADIAQESSALLRTQILQQAATSVLAQANQQPALALKLLR